MMSRQSVRTDRLVENVSVPAVTPREQIASAATVTADAVKPATADANIGGGPRQARTWREADASYPTDPDNRDPISAFPVLKALLRQMEEGVISTPEPSPLASAFAL